MEKRKQDKQPLPIAMQYAHDVLAGRVVACKWVKLAAKRHLDDLEHGHERGLYFDEGAAQHAIDFYRFCKHSKGEWAGQPIEPEPWQQFIDWVLFGWMREDGTRRFRTAYEEVARKNGKTTKGAVRGNYMLSADGEAGAECYTAATKRDQARIAHAEATRMVKKSPALSRHIKWFKDNLNIPNTASKFEPLGADVDGMDGLNVHFALVDEIHAHKTRKLWDVIETATGSRRQPLISGITTAGYDRDTICFELHTYTKQVLDGTVQDDTFFGIIFTIDDDDDWTDETCWIKANPNLGVSVKLDDLQRKCEKAKKIPAAQNSFKRLHLNVWTQQSDRWIDVSLWDENYIRKINENTLRGRLCYGGLDLSSVSDITAWLMLFPDLEDPEYVDVLCRFWCPEARLYDTQNRYASQYQAWARDGFLMATPGDAVDYSAVKTQILEDASIYQVDSINVDRLFQGYQLSMELGEEGLNIVAFGMGFLSMAGPCRELESRLLKRKINHGDNPVLRFMADGVAVKEDPAGNKKPDKAASQCKIDGIVALLMALDRMMRGGVGTTKSRYEDPTARVIAI